MSKSRLDEIHEAMTISQFQQRGEWREFRIWGGCIGYICAAPDLNIVQFGKGGKEREYDCCGGVPCNSNE